MGQQGKAHAAVNLRALELVREAFTRAGLTQEALEDRSGVPRSTIANIMSKSAGPRTLNVDTFVRLAAGLEADIGEWVAQLEAIARREAGVADVVPLGHSPSGPVQTQAARRTGRKPSGRGLDQVE